MFQQPRTSDQALSELLELTPAGWALPNVRGTRWASWLTPISSEWSLIEQTAADMVEEISPLTAVQMLPDYQRVLGPDPYGRDAAGLELTDGQEAQLAYSRWTETGNSAPSDYLALAASMGATVTITQYWPTKCGVARCGQDICADRWLTCGAAQCGDLLGRKKIVFTWLATLPSNLKDPAICGLARCGDPLGDSAPGTLLAAVMAGEAPSHTNPVFAYT